ncbi:MAG TPA: UDP-N-acetylmuramoyl-L-alanyl-D-glutamate--2,6-diaminopimelate ligase [Bacteroidales bacterium]|nr:UDP-N-acetylmuramoyl-L-alanyl-D-glutamate--2,6-diaminopimelate ligase [Bacteroidales bacterium]
MKNIDDILKGIDVLSISGKKTKVADISFDSRNVREGTLFVAVRGVKSNGHDFIPNAIKCGACAIICETFSGDNPHDICIIKVSDSSLALGIAASNFFDNPSASMKLVGVTGTNGKTTIATLLYRVFMKKGYKCGLFSTVCNYINDKELPATHTTPDPIQLNRTMSEMVREGCKYAFMEVSSHSVDQKRISGLSFVGGIFTNLTHDHLDYHKTFDNYLAAKKGFFDSLPTDAFALVNADDRNGKVMLQNCKARHFTFSLRTGADFMCAILERDFGGMKLRVQGEEVWTRFIGDYNASNLLAVYGASELLGGSKNELLTIISDLHPVAGRLEVIRSDKGITGIVDYAHTPDALVNVLDTLNRIKQQGIKIITVVGAGGDRDRTKRPKMAAISAEGSDRIILTSDNPRTENPESILDEMEVGITTDLKKKTLRIADRREAIRTAVMFAEAGDVILVAGKGHETYQEVNGVKHHFDDREVLKEAFSGK